MLKLTSKQLTAFLRFPNKQTSSEGLFAGISSGVLEKLLGRCYQAVLCAYSANTARE